MLHAILFAWLTSALGLYAASRMLDGVRLARPVDAIWAGLLLAFLQWLLGTLVFVLLGIATLGIGFLLWFVFTWIASALVIRITGALSSRLVVDGFIPALLTSFLVAAAGALVRWLL